MMIMSQRMAGNGKRERNEKPGVRINNGVEKRRSAERTIPRRNWNLLRRRKNEMILIIPLPDVAARRRKRKKKLKCLLASSLNLHPLQLLTIRQCLP